MANRDRIPAYMLEVVEEHRIAEWAARGACRNFPNCLGDEPCNDECDQSANYGDGFQWGDK